MIGRPWNISDEQNNNFVMYQVATIVVCGLGVDRLIGKQSEEMILYRRVFQVTSRIDECPT